MIAFPDNVCVPIVNHLTGRRYDLVPAAELRPDSATVARIVAVCNEPEVYRWLFREPLEGRPYPEAWARDWIEWAKAGWHSRTHFVFAVLDDTKRVAAACDIKSNARSAEIGYWASQEQRGVMTNAVVAVCDLAASAGFAQLFARTKKNNVRSEALLTRAGFQRDHDRGDDHAWFTRTLRTEELNQPPVPAAPSGRGSS